MTVSMTLPQSMRHQVAVDGRVITLQPTTHRLIEFMLMQPPGVAVPLKKLAAGFLEHPHTYVDGGCSAVRTHIVKARAAGVPIKTHTPHGYLIER